MKKKNKDFHLFIPSEKLASIRKLAESTYRNPSQIINLAIDNFLKTVGKNENINP